MPDRVVLRLPGGPTHGAASWVLVKAWFAQVVAHGPTNRSLVQSRRRSSAGPNRAGLRATWPVLLTTRPRHGYRAEPAMPGYVLVAGLQNQRVPPRHGKPWLRSQRRGQ